MHPPGKLGTTMHTSLGSTEDFWDSSTNKRLSTGLCQVIIDRFCIMYQRKKTLEGRLQKIHQKLATVDVIGVSLDAQ